MTWEVVDSYGVVVHAARTLTACGVWIDPILGVDFSGKAWGKDEDGRSIDADRFTRNPDGTYTVKMYEGGGGIGGTLTVRKKVP